MGEGKKKGFARRDVMWHELLAMKIFIVNNIINDRNWIFVANNSEKKFVKKNFSSKKFICDEKNFIVNNFINDGKKISSPIIFAKKNFHFFAKKVFPPKQKFAMKNISLLIILLATEKDFHR